MEKHINNDDLRDALTGNMNDWLKEHLETCDNCFNKAWEKKDKIEALHYALIVDSTDTETPHLTEVEIRQYNQRELDGINSEVVEGHGNSCEDCNRKIKRRTNEEKMC